MGKLQAIRSGFFRPRPVDIAGLLEKLYVSDTHVGETGCCAHQLPNLIDDDELRNILDEFAKSLHEGKTGPGEINERLYFKTAKKLAEAITSNVPVMQYDDPNNLLRAALLGNIYAFSGAKSMTQATTLAALILDENGQIKPFNQYRQEVNSILGLYNEQYLSAEYQNAIASAQSAVQWNQWTDDDYLEYRTAGDDRVRESHRQLDGLVLKRTSPVWNRIYPPNDWGCRCTVIPAASNAATMSDQDAGTIGKTIVTNPLFDNNPGKSLVVFEDGHPYFQAKPKELDPVKHYGMRSVDRIMTGRNRPVPFMQTDDEFLAWWTDKADDKGGFDLQDKDGYYVRFTNGFKGHINRKKEGRYEYAANLVDVFINPDEKWLNRGRDRNTWVYIKYYQDYPYVLLVDEVNGNLVAETFYRVDKPNYSADFTRKRRGVLLHKK